MKTFKPALWDGSDPAYAPCMSLSDGILYWAAPKKYRAAGYKHLRSRLVGKPGDGLDLDRATKCREYTREMVRWYEGDELRFIPGAWGSLIARYKGDDVSPMQDVEPNTRENYLRDLSYWEQVLAADSTSGMTFVEAKTIVRKMQEKGRSDHFISTKFGALRRVARYGKALRWPGIDDVVAVLGELRLRTPKDRSVSPTWEQVKAIIDAADAAGDTAFATGILIQWRLSLRAMDVRGDYFKLRPGEKPVGIVRSKSRWAKGLTWDMIDRGVTTLTKTPSKTERTAPEGIEWDLTLVPDLRERLAAIKNRIGPVIVDKRGMPYDRFMWSDLWRKYRKIAKVPDHIWMMDTRAGAANEAEAKGASVIDMQKQLNHASADTTQRYIREKSRGVNNVLRIRGTDKKQH